MKGHDRPVENSRPVPERTGPDRAGPAVYRYRFHEQRFLQCSLIRMISIDSLSSP